MLNGFARPLTAVAILVLLAFIPFLLVRGCDLSRPDQVRLDGSSTVYPIAQALAEEFAHGRRVQVKVGISGTGGGFEKFCRGDIDIAAASRAITPAERETCARKGITEILEFPVAIDAITVLVSQRNDFVQCLSVDELANIFRDGGARTWRDVRPEWPDRPINLYHPGADSGTFDYFTEAVLEGGGRDFSHRTNGNASEDDNTIAVGVREDPYGIAYLGFAYYQEAGDSVRAVEIDNGDGCVVPTVATAQAGEYQPLTRTLYFYANEARLRDQPTLVEFFDFAYNELSEIIEETGYINLPGDQLDAARQLVARLAPAARPEE